MKIIHVVGTLDESAGGPSRSVSHSCQQLAKMGISIDLVARPSKNPVDINESHFLKVHYLSKLQLINFGISLSNEDVKIVHLQHVWDPYIHIMARICRLKGIPYIITPRGMLEPWIMEQNPWKKRLGMFFYQRNDLNKAKLIHATCSMEKTNIQKLGIKNTIKIISNGIEISKFSPIRPTKVINPRKILFLSRIHKKKGIEFLINAWSKIDGKLKQNWVIEIVGNGDPDYIALLKQIIIENELESEITILPPIFSNNKLRAFRESSIFVLPSYSENFGIVVAEALASFTPVITTTGTPWEELKTHNSGWWIEIGTNPLLESLEKAITLSDEEILKMGENGRKLVEKNYSIEFVANQLSKMYGVKL